MVLARWQATIVDDAGDVQGAASVEVRAETVGSPLVLIYSDRAGATPLSNPMTADTEGFAGFHVAGGVYKITATKGVFSRTWRYVAIGTLAEQDAASVVLGSATLSGHLDLAETAVPPNPDPATARLYAYDEAGVTRLAYKAADGSITPIRGSSPDFDFQNYR